MQKKTGIIFILLMAGICSSLTAQALDKTYEFFDLGVLDSNPFEDGPLFSIAHGINESSQVTGRSGDWPPQFGDAFQASTSAINLVDLSAIPAPYGRTDARDINDNGWIVGDYREPFAGPGVNTHHGFAKTPLSTITFSDFTPTRVNNNNGILGSYVDGANLGQWALWNGGSATTVPLAFAADINNSDAVVGDANFGAGLRGALWAGGGLQELSALSGHESSSAAAINDLGQVVGWSKESGGASHLVRWDAGSPTDLGVLSDEFQIASFNQSNQIIGRATNVSGSYAAMWENGQLLDLNTFLAPGTTWYLTAAEDVNDKGQIVGYGYVDGQPFERAFLLSPVVTPEPAGLGLFALGGTALWFWRRRRAGAPHIKSDQKSTST